MKSKTLTLSLLSSIFYGAVESFNAPALLIHRPNSLKRNGRGKESIASTFTSSSTQLNYSPISPTELAPVIDYLNLDGPDDLLSSNIQKLEAQLFGDMAHLILDFGTILNPDTIVLRLFIFLGRICSILSDYVPDHSMTYDETLFQFSMLAISSNMLFKKFRIAIASLNETTSFKDRRIYQRIFYPAGFSWFQYKSLLASAGVGPILLQVLPILFPPPNTDSYFHLRPNPDWYCSKSCNPDWDCRIAIPYCNTAIPQQYFTIPQQY